MKFLQASNAIQEAAQLLYQRELNLAEKTVLEGSWNGLTYEQLAEKSGYSINYLKQDVGPRLWRLATEMVGVKVSKSSFRELLEKEPYEKVVRKNLNTDSQEAEEFLLRPHALLKQDLREAPDVSAFYGRKSELQKIKQIVVKDKCRLVAILGQGGIGKTSLASKFVNETKDEFEFAIWLSLVGKPSIENTLDNLIGFLLYEAEKKEHVSQIEKAEKILIDNKISILLKIFRKHKCLVVFDNLDSILKSNDIAGKFSDNKEYGTYEEYGLLIRRIAEEVHQSCMLITSREEPLGLSVLEGDRLKTRILKLKGLEVESTKSIFIDKGLEDFSGKDHEDIVGICKGNPLVLKIVIPIIQDQFQGDIKKFIDQKIVVIYEVRHLLDSQFDRLTELEKSVIYWLMLACKVVSTNELKEDILLLKSQQRLIEAIESLSRRSLIEERGIELFSLQPVIEEYIAEKFIIKICEEIVEIKNCINKKEENFGNEVFSSAYDIYGEKSLIVSHPLMKAQAEEYIKDRQVVRIIRPIVSQLLKVFFNREKIISHLNSYLDNSPRQSLLTETGYAPGSVCNLLSYMNANLKNRNLSGLPIWQANFQNISLHKVNFKNSDLRNSVFSETLGDILSVDFSHNGKLLAAGDTDGKFHVWRVNNPAKPIKHLTNSVSSGWVRAVAFSPPPNANATSLILATAHDDCSIRLWNISSGQCISTLKGHSNWVRSIDFSPDGKKLVSCSDDKTFIVWDVLDPKKPEILEHNCTHKSRLRVVRFSENGKFIASAGDDCVIKIWIILESNSFQLENLTQFITDKHVRAVAFSSNNDLVAASIDDLSVRIWNLNTQECVAKLKNHKNWIRTIQFNYDGSILASGGDDNVVLLWDVNSKKILRRLEGHTSRIWTVSFSPDRKTFVSGSDHQSIKLWDVSYADDSTRDIQGKCLKTIQGYTRGVRSISFSPSVGLLASGSDDGIVRLWKLDQCKKKTNYSDCCVELLGHKGRVWSVAFSSTGKYLVSCSDDNTIRLWKTSSGSCRILKGHTDWVRAVAFHRYKEIIASGSDDNTVRLWNINSDECSVLEGHTDWVRAVAFHPKGQILISGSDDQTVSISDSPIKIWDIKKLKNIDIKLEYTSGIRSLSISPNGDFLAVAGDQSDIFIWSLDEDGIPYGQPKKLRGHKGRVWSVNFTDKNDLLVSGGDDCTVRIWNVHELECISKKHHSQRVRSVCFSVSSGSRLIASGSQDETIKLWDDSLNRFRENGLSEIRNPKPYEGMNITNVTGINNSQRKTLLALGATEDHNDFFSSFSE